VFTDEASPCLEDLGEPDQIWLEDVHTDHVTKALELSLYLVHFTLQAKEVEQRSMPGGNSDDTKNHPSPPAQTCLEQASVSGSANRRRKTRRG